MTRASRGVLVLLAMAFCTSMNQGGHGIRAFANPANAHAPDPRGHLESPVAPPAGRTTEKTPEAVEPARSWARGSFVSVQVNVTEFGDNIVGDAANEPSIAVDPTDPNRIAIGWRQFDTIASSFRQSGWAYSDDGGTTWRFPGVLHPTEFASDPVLASNENGDFYYYSLQPNRGPGEWACYLYKSIDGGITWPQNVYGFGGDKAWINVDRTSGIGNGHVYIAWSPAAGCCPGRLFTRSTDGGLSFLDPIAIPSSPFWGTLTVGPGGEVYIAGIPSSGQGGSVVVVRSSNAQDPSLVPSFDALSSVDLDGFVGNGTGPNPGGLLGQAWIASDHSGRISHGNLYVLASVIRFSVNDPLDVMFSRSTDGGATWSSPVRVNDDPQDNGAWQWFGTMSIAPDGRIDVFWNDTRANASAANLSELYYAYSTDGGVTWSENQPVSPVFDSWIGWPQQNKIGDYYHSVSDNLGVSLAYAATFNGEQDVYYLRINRPLVNCAKDTDCDDGVFCNGVEHCTPAFNCEPGTAVDCDDGDACNGVERCDALLGSCVPGEITDCNENGVDDSCDLLQCSGEPACSDCNANAIPDSCDLMGIAYLSESPRFSPVGNGVAQNFEIVAPPFAVSDVTLTITARADLGDPSKRIDVWVNGVSVGSVFDDDGHFCSAIPETAQVQVPADTFNAHFGIVAIALIPSAGVNPALCTPTSFVNVAVEYLIRVEDLNKNGVPDNCELCEDDAVCDDGSVCRFNRCVDGLCSQTTTDRGDVADGAGQCGPNGSVDLLDILAVLNAFHGSFAGDCGMLDLDIAGEQGSCTPNGVIDLSDIIAVLDSFRGTDPCCAVTR